MIDDLKDIRLFRCTITKEYKKYFIGKDVFNNTYYIKKNEATRKYEVGTNDSFYAKVETKGLLFKRIFLSPLKYDKYINLINNK